MALDGLEEALKEDFPPTTRKGQQAKVHLVRYADDFIVSGVSKEILEQTVKPLVERFMQERGLHLSEEKTHITHIEQGFDFLGQNVRKYRGKLLIKPTAASVRGVLTHVREVMKANLQATAGHLIAQLNPIIRGWAMYHRHVVSSQVFSLVDHRIFQLLWQWVKRRHPTKGRRWMKEKYFQHIAGRQWVFSGEVEGRTGEKLTLHLRAANTIAIRRHRLIKGAANPYDPEREAYFEERLGTRWQEHWLQRRKLIALWREQEERCPVCSQKITKESGWSLYHIRPRVYGGTDTMSNLLLLHPYCHERVRYQKVKVTKSGIQQVP